MPNFVTKVGKILSRQKSPDRYTLVSIFKPKDIEERNHGVLYFILEILSPDPAMSRVAKMIEDTVIEEYYQNTSNGLTSLEHALKKVNDALANFAEEGEVGWVGKINGIIATLEGNTLHLTQAGTVEAYMVRGGKMIHVSEGLSSAADRPNPLKTFVNITSGELELGDRLIFSTSELFYHFSLDDLKRIVAKFPPAQAATYVVKALQKEEIECINTLVLELTTEEALHEEGGEAEERNAMAEWIGEETPALQKYVAKALPIFNFLLRNSKKGLTEGFKKSRDIYKERISPNISKMHQEASRKVNEKVSEIAQKKGLKTPGQDFWDENEKFFKKGAKVGEKGPQQELFEAPRRSIFAPVTKVLVIIKITILKVKDRGKEQSQLYAIIGILLITVIVVSSIFSYQNRKAIAKRNEIAQKYEQIAIKTDASIKAKELGDEKKSRELLTQAQEEIKAIIDSKYMGSEISVLIEKIDAESEKLFLVKRLNDISPIASFTAIDPTIKIEGLYKSKNKLFSFDKERNTVLSYSLDTKNATKIAGAYFEGNLVHLTTPDNKDIALIATTNPNSIYSYNAGSDKVDKKAQITGEAWSEATGIGTFFNNIYLLVPKENQIYKYVALTNNYGSKTAYLKSNENLADAVDMAIDSSIYVLMKDGAVNQYLTGERTAFKLSALPTQMKSNDPAKITAEKLLDPIRIITTKDLGSIFIADRGAKRVVVYDKEGNYKAQYISDKFNDLKDIWVSKEDNKVYVLSGADVYEVGL